MSTACLCHHRTLCRLVLRREEWTHAHSIFLGYSNTKEIQHKMIQFEAGLKWNIWKQSKKTGNAAWRALTSLCWHLKAVSVVLNLQATASVQYYVSVYWVIHLFIWAITQSKHGGDLKLNYSYATRPFMHLSNFLVPKVSHHKVTVNSSTVKINKSKCKQKRCDHTYSLRSDTRWFSNENKMIYYQLYWWDDLDLPGQVFRAR